MSDSGLRLFDYPKQARFGQVVPKRKIYQHTDANQPLKDLFVQDVDRITWAFKLAPETINIPATEAVSEIQVFRVELKRSELDHKVLQAIDKAIPFPILFELSYRRQIKLAAAYKRPHDSDSTRWVVSRYFESDWQQEETPREPLPIALNLSVLYEQLLIPLVTASTTWAGIPSGEGIQDAGENLKASDQVGIEYNTHGASPSLEQRVALANAIDAKRKEIDRIHARLKREKQFNKRVAINSELREAKQQLAQLQAPQSATVNH